VTIAVWVIVPVVCELEVLVVVTVELKDLVVDEVLVTDVSGVVVVV
jgi:hypothetical protein